MIGKIITGKSFRGCISYCLGKDQAEVLKYNLCYGDKKELLVQFTDVRNQNLKLSKPVQHLTLSMANGERLNSARLICLAEDCSKQMSFEKNQYLVVAHHDTGHQHIHIIINRVGMDGKTLSDSNNYKKMADCCRILEEKYGLQKVRSPNRFLPREQRLAPRFDSRKEKLKQDIKECLGLTMNYVAFAEQIKKRGYIIEKGRGIAFTDRKKVRFKGSEVGYSLPTIEKIIAQNSLAQLQSMTPQYKSLSIKTASIERNKLIKKTTQLLMKPAFLQESNQPTFIKKKKRKKGI